MSHKMINFDDRNSTHGRYYYDLERWKPKDWWTTRHPVLGVSPLSALCANRFGDVGAVLVAEGPNTSSVVGV